MTEKKRWVLSAIMSVMVTSGYAYADTAPNNQNGQAFYNQSAPGIPNSGAIYEAAPTPQQAVTPQAQQQVNNVSGQANAMPIGAPGENNMSPNSAPQSLPPLPNNAMPTQSMFEQVTGTYTSVTPNQIRSFKNDIIARQKAAAENPDEPKPVTGSIAVSLSPGSVPPVIRPYINHTTSFVVVDSSGAPWPVENFRIGNKEAFSVERLDAASPDGSTFTIDAKAMFAKSNLVLKLKGVPTPVMIDLIAGQKVMDERVEVRVRGRGPNATLAAAGTLPEATDSRLLPILDGIAPEGGKQVKVIGSESTKAWLAGGKMVVRTPLKIISPASRSFVSSSDGTNVYVFTPSTQLVGLENGNVVNLSIQDW